jgi:hypothetical protein
MTVSALLRLVERESGFGTIIAKGDAQAGAILIVLAERGHRVRLLERLLRGDGIYGWDSPLSAGHNEADIDKFLNKRLRFDPDSWVIELDTASAERFADEISAFD